MSHIKGGKDNKKNLKIATKVGNCLNLRKSKIRKITKIFKITVRLNENLFFLSLQRVRCQHLDMKLSITVAS